MIKFFQLIICAVTFSSVTAQNLISYQGAFGGAITATVSVNTPDGGYILFYDVLDNVDHGQISTIIYGSKCVVAVKYDENHTIEWQYSYGGDLEESVGDAQLVSDGVVLICSSNSGLSGNKSTEAVGVNHVWVIKIDFSGNIIWQKSIGGDGSDFGKKIIQLTDNNLMLLCGSNSDISGNKTEDSYGNVDYWLVKIDNTGDVVWDKTLGSGNTDIPIDIKEFQGDKLIISGESYDGPASGLKSEPNYGFIDIWLVCLNQADGNLVWEKTIGGDNFDFSPFLSVSQNNIFVLCSSSYSSVSGIRTVEKKGEFDSWLIKIDELGDILTQNSFGGHGNDSAKGFLIDNNNLIIALASSSDVSGNKTEDSRGGLDYWILKVDLDCGILNQKTLGGNQSDNPEGGVLKRSNGNYLIFGYSNSSVSGDRLVANSSGTDTWIVELDAVTLSIKSGGELSYKAFPNPFTDNVTVALPEGIDIAQVHIHDVSGKRLQTMSSPQIENNQIVLDLAYLQPGVYFIHVHHGATSGVLRLVKE